MAITAQPSGAMSHLYVAALSAAATVFVGKGNLYGFLVENNGATDIYLSVYDSLLANVIVGTTAPAFTVKVPASAAFGKDAIEISYRYFSVGCVVAAVTTRNGAALATAPSCQFWSKSNEY